jgi:hypothetical protein
MAYKRSKLATAIVAVPGPVTLDEPDFDTGSMVDKRTEITPGSRGLDCGTGAVRSPVAPAR